VRYPGGFELPEEQQQALSRAKRLEWISIAYWISAIVLLYFTLGQSQAMKAAWVEDILSLFPPIAFLIAARFRDRQPSGRFPWGYHRSITVAYLVATVALFALGLFIIFDSVEKLLKGDHPPIGLVEIFGTQIWLGWLMMGALLYGVVPSLILGHLKKPLADQLHDKVLFADAKMNRADWMTAAAAMAGVAGIGLGLWWADAIAAIFIGADIIWDGQRYLRESVSDLMDESPKTYDESEPHPLIGRVKREVVACDWVAEGAVRLREQGHVLGGDVWVVPKSSDGAIERAEELTERILDVDWRLHDIHVSLVATLEDFPEETLVETA
jgi:cation diffusion facilitator family transporter